MRVLYRTLNTSDGESCGDDCQWPLMLQLSDASIHMWLTDLWFLSLRSLTSFHLKRKICYHNKSSRMSAVMLYLRTCRRRTMYREVRKNRSETTILTQKDKKSINDFNSRWIRLEASTTLTTNFIARTCFWDERRAFMLTLSKSMLKKSIRMPALSFLTLDRKSSKVVTSSHVNLYEFEFSSNFNTVKKSSR